jgi:hypothetical protein
LDASGPSYPLGNFNNIIDIDGDKMVQGQWYFAINGIGYFVGTGLTFSGAGVSPGAGAGKCPTTSAALLSRLDGWKRANSRRRYISPEC